MTLPRAVVPGRTYLITRRCQQRMFLLRPDAEVNNAYVYCLALAAQQCEIEVVMTCAMSNHHHTVIHDPKGRYPEFCERFHKLIARCLNVHWGRHENLWSSQQVSVVWLVGNADIVDKIVYAALNPVNADCVQHATEWPGVNGYGALIADEPLVATRPRFFFRQGKRSELPERLELHFVLPERLGNPALVRRRIAELVEAGEQERRELRRVYKRRVLGAAAVLATSHTYCATQGEEDDDRSPRVAARDKEERVRALRANQEFVAAYREARAALLVRRRARRSAPVTFPYGTWWLRRNVAVPVRRRTAAMHFV